MKKKLIALTVLNVVLLLNLALVVYAFAMMAAGVAWPSEVLLLAGPILAIVGTVIALRRPRSIPLAVVNAACFVPYALLFSTFTYQPTQSSGRSVSIAVPSDASVEQAH